MHLDKRAPRRKGFRVALQPACSHWQSEQARSRLWRNPKADPSPRGDPARFHHGLDVLLVARRREGRGDGLGVAHPVAALLFERQPGENRLLRLFEQRRGGVAIGPRLAQGLELGVDAVGVETRRDRRVVGQLSGFRDVQAPPGKGDARRAYAGRAPSLKHSTEKTAVAAGGTIGGQACTNENAPGREVQGAALQDDSILAGCSEGCQPRCWPSSAFPLPRQPLPDRDRRNEDAAGPLKSFWKLMVPMVGQAVTPFSRKCRSINRCSSALLSGAAVAMRWACA